MSRWDGEFRSEPAIPPAMGTPGSRIHVRRDVELWTCGTCAVGLWYGACVVHRSPPLPFTLARASARALGSGTDGCGGVGGGERRGSSAEPGLGGSGLALLSCVGVTPTPRSQTLAQARRNVPSSRTHTAVRDRHGHTRVAPLAAVVSTVMPTSAADRACECATSVHLSRSSWSRVRVTSEQVGLDVLYC